MIISIFCFVLLIGIFIVLPQIILLIGTFVVGVIIYPFYAMIDLWKRIKKTWFVQLSVLLLMFFMRDVCLQICAWCALIIIGSICLLLWLLAKTYDIMIGYKPIRT